MTKENILFSIIGVLLGVIVGYVFATNINQREAVRREMPAARSAGQIAPDAELPENHPPIPPNVTAGESAGPVGAANGGAAEEGDAAVIEKAQAEPGNFDAQMQAGMAQYQNRRFDEALALFTRANQLRPDDYQAVISLGNTNFDIGRYEAAEKWYTAALGKNPKDINVRTDLGLTFLLREPPDIERSIQEFRRSLEINPAHEQTLQNMVVALTKKGSLGEAEAMLKKLEEVNPNNQGLTKLRDDLEARRADSKQPVSTRRTPAR